MSYSEYEGKSIEDAIAKLRAKSFHDEEDKAFARARADYFSPEELASITGDELADAPKAPKEPKDDKKPEDDEEEVEGQVSAKLKLDELQAIAVEAGLDTSGTKAELIDRINEARKTA